MALVTTHVKEVRLQVREYGFQSGWRRALDQALEDVIPMLRAVEFLKPTSRRSARRIAHRCVSLAVVSRACS